MLSALVLVLDALCGTDVGSAHADRAGIDAMPRAHGEL